jgi:hypothetical protein
MDDVARLPIGDRTDLFVASTSRRGLTPGGSETGKFLVYSVDCAIREGTNYPSFADCVEIKDCPVFSPLYA